ncbi:MAG: hypothetical protein P8090_02045, partial [Gammaproteobacteria bacterium]
MAGIIVYIGNKLLRPLFCLSAAFGPVMCVIMALNAILFLVSDAGGERERNCTARRLAVYHGSGGG